MRFSKKKTHFFSFIVQRIYFSEGLDLIEEAARSQFSLIAFISLQNLTFIWLAFIFTYAILLIASELFYPMLQPIRQSIPNCWSLHYVSHWYLIFIPTGSTCLQLTLYLVHNDASTGFKITSTTNYVIFVFVLSLVSMWAIEVLKLSSSLTVVTVIYVVTVVTVIYVVTVLELSLVVMVVLWHHVAFFQEVPTKCG